MKLMRILKFWLTRRIIVFGFSLMVITAAFLIINHKFYAAGTFANPLLVDNKFCSNPASPDQQNCTSFISSVLAQSISSPYQNVNGDVAITGKVGIGTANPGQKLEVSNGWIQQVGAGPDGAARIGVSLPANPNGISGWWFSENTDGKFAIHQNGVGDRLNIDGNGKVGIGTANPGAKLAVNASGTSTGIFIGDGTNAYGASLLQINASVGYVNWIFEIGKNNSSIFHVDANGNEYAVTNNATSDRRLKTNITPLAENNGLSAINQLKPVTFNWLSQDYAKTEQIGLLAQDVEKVFPQLVSEGGTTTIQLAGGDSQIVNGTKSLNYSGLIPPVVKSIQTLSQKVEAQQKEIDLLKQEIEALKAR